MSASTFSFTNSTATARPLTPAPMMATFRRIRSYDVKMEKKKRPQYLKGLDKAARALDLQEKSEKPNFYERVYRVVEQIPVGKVTTYGAIAETLGMKGSSRLVGQALGALPDGSEVPAQRVINRIGALSGCHKFGGYDRMRSLLVKEGVTFKDEIVDMSRHFWDPRLVTNSEK
jgi:methylated-DNA-protein-cysteine methyltransferase related protein